MLCEVIFSYKITVKPGQSKNKIKTIKRRFYPPRRWVTSCCFTSQMDGRNIRPKKVISESQDTGLTIPNIQVRMQFITKLIKLCLLNRIWDMDVISAQLYEFVSWPGMMNRTKKRHHVSFNQDTVQIIVSTVSHSQIIQWNASPIRWHRGFIATI